MLCDRDFRDMDLWSGGFRKCIYYETEEWDKHCFVSNLFIVGS